MVRLNPNEVGDIGPFEAQRSGPTPSHEAASHLLSALDVTDVTSLRETDVSKSLRSPSARF